MKNIYLFTLFIQILVSNVCFCQQIALYWENDGTWAKPNEPEDRHYTNGNRIELCWQAENEDFTNFCSMITGRDVYDKISCNMGIFVAHHMQTPDHISKPNLRPDAEMQYAATLYGGPFIQVADDNLFDHFELGVGVLGPSAHGEYFQDRIHDVRGFSKAVDWDSQMGNRFAMDFRWIKKVRFVNKRNPNLDFTGESFITAGTIHRHGGLGITARYGSELPNNFGPAKINSPAFYNSDNNSYIYGFLRLAGSYVEYNQYLAELEKNDFLGELQTGITITVGKLELSYSQVFMTNEYKDQSESDSYGNFTCLYRF